MALDIMHIFNIFDNKYHSFLINKYIKILITEELRFTVTKSTVTPLNKYMNSLNQEEMNSYMNSLSQEEINSLKNTFFFKFRL